MFSSVSILTRCQIIVLIVMICLLATPTVYAADHTRKQDTLKPIDQKTGKGRIQLTENETAWLKAHPKITFGFTLDHEPSLMKDENGNYSGHLWDFLQLVNSRSGVNIQLETFETKKAIQKLMNGKLDGALAITKEAAKSLGVTPTDTYFSAPITIFTRDEIASEIGGFQSLINRKVALIEGGLSLISFIKQTVPEVEIVYVKNNQTGMRLVFNGKVDAFVGYSLYNFLIGKYQLSGVVPAFTDMKNPHPFVYGIRPDWPELVSIVDKVIASTTIEERIDILEKWSKMGFGRSEKPTINLTEEELSWLKAHPTIRLGFNPDMQPLLIQGVDGNNSGILPDIFKQLEAVTGLNVSIEIGPWPVIIKQAGQGEIDGLLLCVPALAKTKGLMPTKAYVPTIPVVFGKRDAPFTIKSIDDLKGKRVAYKRAVKFIENLLTPLGNETTAIEVNSIIDALTMVDTYLLSQSILTGIEPVFIDTSYVIKAVTAVRSDWPELVGILNKGLDALGGAHINKIVGKWIGLQTSIQKVSLTKAEKAWLKQHPSMRLGIDPSWPPVEYFDTEGKLAGITSDNIRILSKKMGIRIETVRDLSWEEVLQQAKQGKIDIISAIAKNKERAEYLLFTKPYLKLPMVIIMREDAPVIEGIQDLRGKTIAVMKDYITHFYLKRDYPEQKLLLFETLAEALQAVAEDKADAVIENAASINLARNELGLTQLTVAAATPYAYELSFGVRKDWPELIPILEKGLASITDREKQIIKEKWINIRFQKQIDWPLVIGISLVIALIAGSIVMIILISNRRLAAEVLQRKQAQVALRKSEERFRTTFEQAPIGIITTSNDGQFLSVNTRFAEMLGYTTDEIMALSVQEVTSPEDRAKTQDVMKRTTEKSRRLITEKSYLRKDGTRMNGRTTVVSLLNADGSVYAKLAAVEDITAEKLALTELQRTKEEMKEANLELTYTKFALDNAPDTILWLRSESADMVYVNKLASKMLGYSQEEMLKLSVFEFDPVYNQEAWPAFRKELRRQGQMTFESIWQRKDGVQYPVEISARSLTYGGEEYFLAFVRDIREQKQAQNELQQAKEAAEEANRSLVQSQERFRLALKGGDLGFWDVNLVTDEMVVNRRWGEMLGRAPDTLDNLTRDIWIRSLHPDDRDRVLQIGEAYRKGEIDTYEVEYRITTRSGRVGWQFSKGEIVERDEEHGVLRMVGTVMDITSRKEAEEKLNQSMEDLKNRVDELAEARRIMLNMMEDFEIAKNEAIEAARAKSEFLANMSHEIRTPMNAVTGMAHLLGQTALTPQQQRYLSNIHLASNSLLGIINDILDFSKLEAGKLKMESIDFLLNNVLTNLSNMISIEAQEKGLEFIIDTAVDIPLSLVGDPLRLEQVLVNLTKNAVKFTEQGEVVVLSELIKEDNDSVTLRFSVRDTGIGLTQEQRSKLFEAFSQADTSTTRKFGGTGLGLVISKRLVEMMDGTLGVESETGKGSTFSFTAQFGIKDKERWQFRLPAADLAELRVLVVDDNKIALEVLRNYLEAFSFNVTTVDSGEKAIHELRRTETSKENLYDLILMDWKMPGISGIETTRRIRAEHEIPRKPHIIMITAHGRELAMEAAKDMEFDAYLVKPVTQSTLFDAISSALGYRADEQLAPGRIDFYAPEELVAIAGAHILLVEDNEINQEVAIGLLKNAGFQVTVTGNGREAVDMMKHKGNEALRQKQGLPIDVVLMDLQMPVMDGYEATRQIRNMEFGSVDDNEPEIQRLISSVKKIPIIAMTADVVGGIKEKCIQAGMNDYVSKPIDPRELFTSLVRWAKSRKREFRPGIGEQEPEISKTDIDTKLEQPQVDLPETLPGIDIADVLNRVAGDKNLLKKLLKKFSVNHGDAVAKIESAITSGDKDAAIRLAHTLKGVSGNIGAQKLHKSAKALEAAIKTEAAEINEFLDGVSAELVHVLSGIADIDEDERRGNDAASDAIELLDITEVQTLLDEIETLLEDDDAEAGKKFLQLKAALKGSAVDEDLISMERRIGEYDFEGALEVLYKMREKL